MSFEAPSDEHLLYLVTQGATDALGELYDRHSRSVFGFALHLLQDPAKAEEVTQEVFVNVWQKAATYNVQRGSFSTWLMTMTHHRAIDELRRNSRRRSALEEATRQVLVDADVSEVTPVEAAQRAETASIVQRALADLPREQREVLVLAYYNGYSQSEIAQRLHQPLGTVKTRMRLGMQKLRTSLAALQELL